jgi:Holliday junction resolvase RusA-like endonuclease
MDRVSFTIQGECASKANSRQPVPRRSKAGRVFIAFIKSEKARRFERECARQIPRLERLFECEVSVTVRCYSATRRPDLDESLVFDCMQGRIFVNDRQVFHKDVTKFIDRNNPRVEVEVRPWENTTKQAQILGGLFGDAA